MFNMARGSTMLTGQIVEKLPDPAPAPEAGSKKVAPQRGVPESVDESQEHRPDLDQCSFVVFHFEKNQSGEAPQEFRSRPAYLALAEEDATDVVPVAGCGLYYHNSTKQWHAIFGNNSERHCGPSWNENLRSERKAILMALVAMWTGFVPPLSMCHIESICNSFQRSLRRPPSEVIDHHQSSYVSCLKLL